MSGITRYLNQPALPVLPIAPKEAPAEVQALYDTNDRLWEYLKTYQACISGLYDLLSRSMNDRHMVGIIAEQPTAAEAGRQFLVTDTTPNTFYVDDGSSWQSLPTWAVPLATTLGGTGLTSYATGDLLYASATNVLSRLAKGTSGYVLQQGASVPSWFNLFGTANNWSATQITSISPTSISGVHKATAHTINISASGNSSAQYYGLLSQSIGVTDFNLTTNRGIVGAYLLADDLRTTGTTTGLLGAEIHAKFEGTGGTVTSAYGAYLVVENTGSGTIGTGYGLYIAPFDRTGTITNSYGVYVEDVTAINYFGNNVGIGTKVFGTSAAQVLGLANGTEPSTSPANMIQLYSKDSSVGGVNATLAIRTEQGVEAIGTFTPSHKLRVWINGVEYWMQLDAV